MILTLYKNCILNDKYYEVFDTKKRGNNDKSAFETYLEGLDNTVIEVENVYVKYYGNILLPYDVATGITALDYNYMKVENDEQTIYTFINSIELVNQVVNLTYAQDVWANWSDKCTIRQGVLSNTNYYSPTDIVSYPIQLESYSQMNYSFNKNTSFKLLIEIQPHNLVQGSDNELRYQVAGYYVETDGDSNITKNSFTIGEIGTIVESLLLAENRSVFPFFKISSEQTYCYYDIVKYIIVPNSDNFPTPTTTTTLFFKQDEFSAGIVLLTDQASDSENIIIDNIEINSTNMSPNAIGYGIIGSIIPMNFNNIGINMTLKLNCACGYITVILDINGTISDVTNSFEIEPYFSASPDDVVTQRKINYNLAKNIQFIKSISNSISTAVSLNANSQKMLRKRTRPSKQLNAFSYYENANEGIAGIATDIFNYQAIIKPQYGNFTLNASSGNPFITAEIGLQEFLSGNKNNKSQVDYCLSLNGYSIYKLIENDNLYVDSQFDNYTGNYRIIGFGFINITGNATQNIIRELENILLKPTRVYLNGTIS